ncbi:dual oxidase 2-like [Bombina bombina]|uniref:dual oxidase 2-like n=1 Tax=Bombina bombina TaxID=8345 RepID=UPI00235A7BE4|nr:dual oxidase 2-like [Bombina bombina]
MRVRRGSPKSTAFQKIFKKRLVLSDPCLPLIKPIWSKSLITGNVGPTAAKSNVNWEVQRYDGWYNNLAHHSLGSAGSKFLRLIPATYADGVYQVAEEPQLPNPRILSDVVMKGESGSESPRNLTVLALFFGYHVLSEISSTEMPACPAEFLNIPIPAGDSVFNNKNASNMVLPFQRSKWFPETGRSPNNPRDQINSVTTWIDGSSIYGSSHSWSDALRHFSGGKLASGSDDLFPKYANKSLPMWQLPNPSTGERGDRGLYGFGNAFGNESPFLQAESIVWFRFHNYMSNRFADTHKDWSDEDLFQHARKWVIAIYQNIAFYEWLPVFLSRNVSNYEGYKQFVDSSISPEFVTLMAQMLQTMMPPGVYMRNNKCDFQNVTGSDGRAWPAFRMCNNYWSRENTNLQTAIKIDELLLGMASQIAEKEDKTVVEDLRDYWYGSMKYSRTDLSAASIQRARDQGLSTYNNMRKYYGLKPKEKWEDIGNQGKELLQNLASLYENDIERLELIPGVMLEINGGPSEIVSNILLDQFHRLRDGDRFWFENEKNGLFTKEEIIWIRSITFQDVLVNVTSENNFQQDVFTWKTGDPCPQPEQLKSQNLEKCVPITITDYFEGSGAGFGVTILALCCLPLVSLIIACAVAKSCKNNFKKYQKKNKDTAFSNASVTQGFQASEWCGPKEPVQLVLIQLHPIQMLKVVNTRQNESRTINLQNQPRVEVLLSNTHGSKGLLLKIPKEYDLVLFFKNEDDRDIFVQQFKHFLGASNIPPSFSHLKEQEILAKAFTKKQRHEILETFFKQSLSHVLDINKADAGDIDRHKIKDALNYEISREEFAESLGLNPQAHFVESMFCFADRDRNGYLSFEEFCHILLTLIKGTAEDKLKFIFSMHDTNGNGILPKEELHRMLRSFSDITKFLTQDQTENVIQSMFNEAGFPSKEEITWDDFYSLFKDHSTILSETRPLTKVNTVNYTCGLCEANQDAFRAMGRPSAEETPTDAMPQIATFMAEHYLWSQVLDPMDGYHTFLRHFTPEHGEQIPPPSSWQQYPLNLGSNAQCPGVPLSSTPTNVMTAWRGITEANTQYTVKAPRADPISRPKAEEMNRVTTGTADSEPGQGTTAPRAPTNNLTLQCVVMSPDTTAFNRPQRCDREIEVTVVSSNLFALPADAGHSKDNITEGYVALAPPGIQFRVIDYAETFPIIEQSQGKKVSVGKQLIDGTDLTSICTVELEAQGLRKRINKSVNGYQLNKPTVYSEARRERYHSSKIRQKIQQFKRLIENYRRHIVCLVIFYGISAGLFVERSYYYGFASPSTGIADTTYVGLIISRGSAATISFMFSYILLTMCRNVITFLRETFLNHYIPFDAAVDFHRLIAMSALILTIFHTVGHLVNVYIFTITPLSILSCLFPATFANDGSEYPKKFYWWFFETVPGMTGVLLLAIMALMYVFSTFHFRRVSFRGFWLVHQLYVLFYILTIMHGSFALIQFPKFHIFFIPPAIIFVIDKLISLSRKKIEINVVQGEQLPSGVVHLKFQRPSTFDYKSGQWVRIACLALGTDEYHPFTLTSAPHEETLSLHIRAVGPWTTRLRELYSTQNMAEMIQAKLYLDGPFGEGHQEWNHFEVSVLVGGGIGVTPFASILKDLVFKSSVNLRIRCKKIYFIWVTRTQRQFEWLTDIIREVENNDRRELVSVHIYITQLAEKFDFRTTMLYICERHFQKIKDKSLLTGLRSITHFGRPPFVDFFNSLQDVHPEVKKFGVFSCGPPGMTKNVENACQQVNKRDEGYFVHHYENF